MQLQIFLRSFGIVLLLLVAPLFRSNEEQSNMELFTRWVLIISVSVIALISDRRYLTDLAVDSNTLTLTYMTQLFRRHTVRYPVNEIHKVQLGKRRKFISWLWLPDLHITTTNEYRYFSIAGQEMYDRVQQQILTIQTSQQHLATEYEK